MDAATLSIQAHVKKNCHFHFLCVILYVALINKISVVQLGMSNFLDVERKPNDCVVCGGTLYELGAQQCHKRSKVECDATGLPMSEYDTIYQTRLVFFYAMVLIISDL